MPMDTSKKNYSKDSWRQRAKSTRKRFDPDHYMEAEKHPSKDDVTMKNTDTGANIRLMDDGSIRIFADNDTGILIDPNSSSIQMFCDTYKADTREYHVKTSDDDKFMWNHMPLNPALKDPFTELMTANCIPTPIPYRSETLFSGTELMKEILTNPGTYLAPSPSNPGLAKLIDTPAVGMEGKRAYKGIKELNMLMKSAEGIKKIVGGS